MYASGDEVVDKGLALAEVVALERGHNHDFYVLVLKTGDDVVIFGKGAHSHQVAGVVIAFGADEAGQIVFPGVLVLDVLGYGHTAFAYAIDDGLLGIVSVVETVIHGFHQHPFPPHQESGQKEDDEDAVFVRHKYGRIKMQVHIEQSPQTESGQRTPECGINAAVQVHEG